jgi:hypothetical protein
VPGAIGSTCLGKTVCGFGSCVVVALACGVGAGGVGVVGGVGPAPAPAVGTGGFGPPAPGSFFISELRPLPGPARAYAAPATTASVPTVITIGAAELLFLTLIVMLAD